MSAQDLEINCQVRGIVSRYWLDPNRLSFQTRRGNVHVSGEVRVTGAEQDDEQIADTLRSIEDDVRRLHGVWDVEFELTNWRRGDSGDWVNSEKRAEADSSEQPAPAARQQSLSAPSAEST